MSPESARKLYDGEITIAQFLGLDQRTLYAIAKIGHDMLKSGNFSGALDIFRGLTAASPYDSVFRTQLGATLANLGRYEEALVEYDLGARYNVANVDAIVGRGELLLRANRVSEALADFQKAVELDPRVTKSSTHRAQTLLAMAARGAEANRAAATAR